MKTSKLVAKLTNQELRNTSGGYAPPTEEQMEWLREKYEPFADIFCW